MQISHLKEMQPRVQRFVMKKFKARYKKIMATGSLNSLRINMEWILYEAQHMKKNTQGGTYVK